MSYPPPPARGAGIQVCECVDLLAYRNEDFLWFHHGKFINVILYIGVSITLTRWVRQYENKVKVMTVDSRLHGNDII